MPTKEQLKQLNDTAIRKKTVPGSISPAHIADSVDAALDFSEQEVKRKSAISLSIREFGVLGDGVTNDVAKFTEALNFMNTTKIPLSIPKGDYLLSGWVTPELSYVNIIGENRKNTFIRGVKEYVNFIKVTNNATVTVSGVTLKGFNNGFYSEERVLDLKIHNNHFEDFRHYPVNTAQRTLFSTSFVENFSISNNTTKNSPGFVLRSGIGSGVAALNIMDGVKRNLSVWNGGSDTATMAVYGICIGDSDDVSPTIAQDQTGNINVFGNVIKNTYNHSTGSTGFATTNGIVVIGHDSNISNNVIDEMWSERTSDVEAIYTKGVRVAVIGNTIVNGGKNSSGIAIKGHHYTEEGPLAKRSIVSDNTITYKTIDSARGGEGIHIYGGQDIDVHGNTIENAFKEAVIMTGRTVGLTVKDNKVYNCAASEPISILASDVVNTEVSGNNFYELYADAGNAYVRRLIRVKADAALGPVISGVTHTGNVDGLIIKGNKLHTDIKAGISDFDFVYVDGAGSKMKGIRVLDNHINIGTSTLTIIRGVNLVLTGSGVYEDVVINGLYLNDASETINFRSVTYNSNIRLLDFADKLKKITAEGIYKNGLIQNVLLAQRVKEGVATFNISNKSFNAIGSHIVGSLPGNVSVTRVDIYASGDHASATNAATIALGFNTTTNTDILAATSVGTLPVNGYVASKMDGAVANMKRYFPANSGDTDVYCTIATEALTTTAKADLQLKVYWESVS